MAVPTLDNRAARCRTFRWPVRPLSVGLAVGLCALGTGWADTSFAPRLKASSVFIDNVDFAASNEDTDYISELTPGFRLNHETRRLQVTADYALQNLWYFERESLNKSYHEGRADLASRWLDGRFTLDAVARYEQQQRDFNGPVTDGNFGADNNREDVRTLGVTPGWHARFGTWARGGLTYSLYDIDEEVDSRNFTADAALSNGPDFSRLQWQLRYRGTRVNYADRSDAKYRDTTATLRYRLMRDFFASTLFGVENNDYLTSPGADDPRGFHWQVGGGWNPSEHTFVELRTGDRFFGRTYFLDARHKLGRIELAATYNEEATNSAAQQIGNVGTGPSAPRNAVETGDSETYIEQDAKFSVTFTGRRNRVQLAFVDENRDFQSTNRREDLQTLRVDFQRRLNRLTTADLSVGRETRHIDLGDNREWFGTAKLERALGRTLFLDLSYSRRSRNANVATADYRVNQVMAGLRMEH